MSNVFLNTMKASQNYGLTENGAVTYRSTLNGVMDMFALGGAYRKRSEDDVWVLFRKAWKEARPFVSEFFIITEHVADFSSTKT